MSPARALLPSLLLASVAASLAACKDEPSKNAAPVASAVASAAPASAGAIALAVDGAGSKATWVMDAPVEKIQGELDGALSGELFVDPGDLGKTTGVLRADLSKLSLYQQKRDAADKPFGERTKNETQNHHARTWLEISDDTPPDVRKKNAEAVLAITKVETDTPDLRKLAGDTRKITGKLTGELLVHGRKAQKTVPFEATFRFSGAELASVSVTTTGPLDVGLEEYDVRPREAFGKLAQKTLGDLAGKVAKTAPVTVTFEAKKR